MPIPEALNSSVQRSYTIAFSVRSGSNELCQLLSKNALGRPTELFQSLPEPKGCSDQAESDVAQRIISIIASNTSNRIFGSKMAHHHRARVDGVFRRSLHGYQTLDDLLPNHRWIWLTRRDKIAQAVSLCRAEKSGVWASLNRDAAAEVLMDEGFDFYHILSRVMMLCASDMAWEAYFKDNAITPYTLVYEDFFSGLPSSFQALAAHIWESGAGYVGGSSSGPDLTPTLAIQRDALSDQWIARFRAYFTSIGDLDMLREFGDASAIWDNFFFGLGWQKGSAAAKAPLA